VLPARTYLHLGDVETSGREASSALASAAEAADTWAAGWALHVLALRAMIRGDLTGALPIFDRALAVTETDPALNDLNLLLQVNKAILLFNLDRCDEALAAGERARQLADRAGMAVRLAQAHGMLAQAFFDLGRWDDALSEITVIPEDLKESAGACCEASIAAEIGLPPQRARPGTRPPASCQGIRAAHRPARRPAVRDRQGARPRAVRRHPGFAGRAHGRLRRRPR
jgi:tetratricopeptide (TPR) repeat protein